MARKETEYIQLICFTIKINYNQLILIELNPELGLSNIYLHYVLDLWFEKVVKPRLKGEAYLVRYIDDFVVCFQYRADVLRFQDALCKRIDKFALALEPKKTR